MRPESTSVTLRRDLSVVVQEFDESKAAKKFIAPFAAPVCRVEQQASTYPVMNRETFKKPADASRTDRGAYNRIEGTFGEGNYSTQDHGLEYSLDDRKAAKYRSFLSFEQAASRILRYKIMMVWERRVAALWSGLGLTNHNVSTAWSTVATADPIGDIVTGAETLEDKCGCAREDLTLIIPRADFRELLATTQIVEKVKYTYPGVQPALLSQEIVAAMLGLRRVVVPRGAYDSAAEGIAESMSQVWPSGILYLAQLAEPRGPGSPDSIDSLETEPSACRTLIWPGDGADDIPVMERYRDETVRAEILRVRDDTDEVATAEADLMGYQITNT
jgi:hypothetical protein